MKALACALLLLSLGGSTARAEGPTTIDTFESHAQGAIRIGRAEDLVWPLTAACDKGDDVAQRQCRIVRDKKAKQLSAAPLLIDADADAFELGAWSAAKKSVAMSLVACIRCGGVEVDGKTYFLTGAGAKVEGNRLRAAALYDNAKTIADEAAATTWKQSIANTRVELVVKVVGKQRAMVSGKDVLPLDIVAWRVVNACSGTVVISSQPSGPATADKAACAAATGGGGGAAGGGGGNGTSVDTTPDSLTSSMVQDAMRPVVAAARECANRMKMSGRTKLELVISADGTISSHQQVGDFQSGTPMGKCIDAALEKVTFPKTKKPTTKIGYPIVL